MYPSVHTIAHSYENQRTFLAFLALHLSFFVGGGEVEIGLGRGFKNRVRGMGGKVENERKRRGKKVKLKGRNFF